MKLSINGEERDVTGVSGLEQLVELLGLPAKAVLIEHNGDALRRDEWTTRTLQDGDRLELIRIVAGG
jgi:sulfur carrier protein